MKRKFHAQFLGGCGRVNYPHLPGQCMRSRYFLFLSAFVCLLGEALVLRAAKPAEFTATDIDAIWTELWKSDLKVTESRIERISEGEVKERLTGKWTVLFGVGPDKTTITISGSHLVGVSGQKEGKDWRNDGEWRVISGKLVLFLERDSIPSFIFRVGERVYIFDPWAKSLRSELKREK